LPTRATIVMHSERLSPDAASRLDPSSQSLS
jgi:hypothetical protein